MFKKSITTATLLLTLSVTSLVTACASAPTLEVNGIEVYENHWEQTKSELGPRASFEMDCSEPLDFTLFKRFGRAPSEVGVSGCGERLMFIREPMGEGYGTMMGPWKVSGDSDS